GRVVGGNPVQRGRGDDLDTRFRERAAGGRRGRDGDPLACAAGPGRRDAVLEAGVPVPNGLVAGRGPVVLDPVAPRRQRRGQPAAARVEVVRVAGLEPLHVILGIRLAGGRPAGLVPGVVGQLAVAGARARFVGAQGGFVHQIPGRD